MPSRSITLTLTRPKAALFGGLVAVALLTCGAAIPSLLPDYNALSVHFRDASAVNGEMEYFMEQNDSPVGAAYFRGRVDALEQAGEYMAQLAALQSGATVTATTAPTTETTSPDSPMPSIRRGPPGQSEGMESTGY